MKQLQRVENLVNIQQIKFPQCRFPLILLLSKHAGQKEDFSLFSEFK